MPHVQRAWKAGARDRRAQDARSAAVRSARATGSWPSPRRWLAGPRKRQRAGSHPTDIVGMSVAERVPVVTATARSGRGAGRELAAAARRASKRSLQRRRAEAPLDDGVWRIRHVSTSAASCSAAATSDRRQLRLRGQRAARRRRAHRRELRDPQCAHRGRRAVILPFTYMDGATIGAGAIVGPFARLRPGAVLSEDVHIGNFVEVKNSTLARREGQPPAYLGDATVGERVNYGAGSITANYDGANKHRTVIGADAHIGSNCSPVAPVTVGEGATIGGGSTIAADAPAGTAHFGARAAGHAAGLEAPGQRRRRSSPDRRARRSAHRLECARGGFGTGRVRGRGGRAARPRCRTPGRISANTESSAMWWKALQRRPPCASRGRAGRAASGDATRSAS